MWRHRKLYPVALQTTLRETAVAYGYTLTVASCAMLLSTLHGAPREAKLFLFVAGGLSGFAGLSGLVAWWRPDSRQSQEAASPRVGTLNFIAVAVALGAAAGVAHVVASDELAWFLVPLAATAIYLSAVAGQVILAGSAQADPEGTEEGRREHSIVEAAAPSGFKTDKS